MDHRPTDRLIRATLLVVVPLLAAGALLASHAASFGPARDLGPKLGPGTQLEVATFAGGCFWCLEGPFEKLDGVLSVVSGYTGGTVENPTYEEVSTGRTGHREAVEVRYDPTRVTYTELVETFWRQIDPTDAAGQFADRGSQYQTAILVHNDRQRHQAETSKKSLAASGRFDGPIVVPILEASTFYPAEERHQDYYKKRSAHYKMYRRGSGRGPYLEETWSDDPGCPVPARQPTFETPDEATLKKRLGAARLRRLRAGTLEAPKQNRFHGKTPTGLFVDAVSGEPLFSSTHRLDGGKGRLAFSRPIEDRRLLPRPAGTGQGDISVLESRFAGTWIGERAKDPASPTGERYTVNSAALRLVPADAMETDGYADWSYLFAPAGK